SNNGKGRVFQSDGKEVKLTLTGYFWRYGIRKAIQVSIFRMNPFKVFHLVTSYTLCAMFFLFLPTAGYIADSYFQQPEFVEKSGAFIVMLGFLLTIKYRVVTPSGRIVVTVKI
ncbi:hypothetical protein ACSTD6_22690, partial [Vibrio vulnificus]|uniref:hypothetical protein n=1 Tax=Vibrio vulnificus TaxID=672 RepID=UPI003EDAC7C1